MNANPLVDEAHHHVAPAGFTYLVTEMACWATGGLQKYTGKSMAEDHSHPKITGDEREAFLNEALDFAQPAIRRKSRRATSRKAPPSI